MTPSALDIGAILVLVLPGFVSYRSALARRADPSRRSTLWQLAEMLEYSLYVHLLGVALVLGVSALLDSAFHLELHLNELPSKQPHEFLSAYFVEGTLLFTLYPLYVVVASVLLGAYSIPHRAATGHCQRRRPLGQRDRSNSLHGLDKAPQSGLSRRADLVRGFSRRYRQVRTVPSGSHGQDEEGGTSTTAGWHHIPSYPIHIERRTSLLSKRCTLLPATRKNLIDWKICQEAGRSF